MRIVTRRRVSNSTDGAQIGRGGRLADMPWTHEVSYLSMLLLCFDDQFRYISLDLMRIYSFDLVHIAIDMLCFIQSPP